MKNTSFRTDLPHICSWRCSGGRSTSFSAAIAISSMNSRSKQSTRHMRPIYDLEDAICQTLDLQTEYAALMRLLVTLPERERTILLSRAMENRSFAELADKYHMGYKGVAAIYYRTIQRIRKELEEK